MHDFRAIETSFLFDWDDGYLGEDMLKLNIWTPNPLPDVCTPALEAAAMPDLRECAWYRFASEIQDLRASGDYRWAEERLAGIQETIEGTRRVTERQRQTVETIRAEERTPSRSYDAYGFRRRWR